MIGKGIDRETHQNDVALGNQPPEAWGAVVFSQVAGFCSVVSAIFHLGFDVGYSVDCCWIWQGA